MATERHISTHTLGTLAVSDSSVSVLKEQEVLRNACFHSETDVRIAQGIADRINSRILNGSIDQETYEKGIQGLRLLVPKRNDQGLRVIADITLTSRTEILVASRLESEEVDVTGPDGIWGGLPEVVKEEIAGNLGMEIQITDKCTNACRFCGLAKKGPVKQKLSIPSLETIFESYHTYQRPRRDKMRWANWLHGGSDPFDAKWKNGTNGDHDYTDLTDIYWKIFGYENNLLFTSTSVPIGEEFRILRFADSLMKRYKQQGFLLYNALRISLTNQNEVRVGAIANILDALYDTTMPGIEGYPPGYDDAGIHITENRDRFHIPMGNIWKLPTTEIEIFMIPYMNCRDTVLIGVDFNTELFHGRNFKREGKRQDSDAGSQYQWTREKGISGDA